MTIVKLYDGEPYFMVANLIGPKKILISYSASSAETLW